MKIENNKYDLVKEMFETIEIIRNFKAESLDLPINSIKYSDDFLIE